MSITISSLSEISSAAKQFVAAMGDNTIFAFYGHMGAGKTTFIKAICEELGVKDVITSPTLLRSVHETTVPLSSITPIKRPTTSFI